MKNMRVLLDSELAPKIMDLFSDARIEADVVKPRTGSLEALVRHGGYSALLLQSKTNIPATLMEAAGKNLEIIGIVGDNMSNLNLIDASNNNIIIKVTEFANTYEAANLTKRLMIYMLSQAFREHDKNRAKIFSSISEIIPDNCSGYELADKTVGLVGCGNVAQTLAMEISPYCTSVLGYDNNPRYVYDQFHQRSPLERPVIDYNQLSLVIEKSDIISIHTVGTQKVLRQEELFFAKKKPFIINTARSGTIDENALLLALKEKRIRGAAFTVPSADIKKQNYSEDILPFLELKNVVIAPSLGKPTVEAHKKNTRKLAQSVIDFLINKDLSLAVNPMDAYAGDNKQRYPIIRSDRQAAIPFRIS